MVKIQLSDKGLLECDKGTILREIAVQAYGRESKKILTAKMDDVLVDLSTPAENDCRVQFFTFNDPEGLDVFRHSSAHLMAHAVQRLFPEAQPTIGPVVEEGFYYDFHRTTPFHPEDLKKIEKEMKRIVGENIPIERKEMTREEALSLFKDNPFKQEMITQLDDTVTVYQQKDFQDLCRGPHVAATGVLRSFALTKVAGAYWHADATKEQLQRIYGVSFPDKKQLQDHLFAIKEAEKRNHRKLGKELELFDVYDEAPGNPFFLPKGTILWNELENFIRSVLKQQRYVEVKSPIIMKKDLWLKSGHWDHYKENMYFVMIDGEEFAVKPMNCPGHMLIFKSRVRSYRELPLRMAEFGIVHRHELSGVLYGLLRVRKFTQDDAHVFCTEKQLEEEIVGCIQFVDTIYKAFGFTYSVELSTKPEKAMGSQEMWDHAESTLKNALSSIKQDFVVNEGDGAFYGPKIDFHIRDALGRTWQCATIQVDFSMPERFDLTYMGEDGRDNHRPVMIHRAIVGSMERFIGILTEHFGAKFPLWISPEQVRIITVSTDQSDYASQVLDTLRKEDLRVELDYHSESVSKKVRTAQMEKVPLIITIGNKEAQSKTLSVRTLDGKVVFGLSMEQFLEVIKKAIREKSLTVSFEKKG